MLHRELHDVVPDAAHGAFVFIGVFERRQVALGGQHAADPGHQRMRASLNQALHFGAPQIGQGQFAIDAVKPVGPPGDPFRAPDMGQVMLAFVPRPGFGHGHELRLDVRQVGDFLQIPGLGHVQGVPLAHPVNRGRNHIPGAAVGRGNLAEHFFVGADRGDVGGNPGLLTERLGEPFGDVAGPGQDVQRRARGLRRTDQHRRDGHAQPARGQRGAMAK